MTLFALDGKVALVTGAGSPGGIGFACARTLRELGATVAVAATSARIHSGTDGSPPVLPLSSS